MIGVYVVGGKRVSGGWGLTAILGRREGKETAEEPEGAEVTQRSCWAQSTRETLHKFCDLGLIG
jgi:hypothetical protein